MNESSSAILKIITALTSPKASIKFISIAVSLIVSWRFFSDVLSTLQVPEEHRGIAFLFISMGVGALVGELIYSLLRIAYNGTLGKYREAKEYRKLRQKQAEQEQVLIKEFTVTYKNFDKDTKRLLCCLSEEVKCLCDSYDCGNNVAALIENGYINKISMVNEWSSVYELHPVLVKYIKGHIPGEIEGEFAKFELDCTREKDDFLMLISGEISVEDVLSKTSDMISFCKKHSEIIDYSSHYKDKKDDDFSNYLAGYYIKVDDFHKPRFEEKFNVKVAGKVLMPLDEFRA